MALRHREQKELTLEQQIIHLLASHGALDWAQISVEILEFDEARIRRAITSLVESEQVEPRLDPGQTENTEFDHVPWGLVTSLRKKAREQRKALARSILGAAPA